VSAPPENASVSLRTGHLLRVNTYLDLAILGLWTRNPRADLILGMAAASVRAPGPDPAEDGLLEKLRDLISEAREYRSSEDFPAAMARLRVAQDLTSLRIIHITGE
jgi:hypothetical protein